MCIWLSNRLSFYCLLLYQVKKDKGSSVLLLPQNHSYLSGMPQGETTEILIHFYPLFIQVSMVMKLFSVILVSLDTQQFLEFLLIIYGCKVRLINLLIACLDAGFYGRQLVLVRLCLNQLLGFIYNLIPFNAICMPINDFVNFNGSLLLRCKSLLNLYHL